MANIERACDDVAREAGGWTATRARLLKRTGAIGLGIAGLSRLTPPARAAGGPTIVVVGAGLAGLTCAYRLRQAGYSAQVHEASARIGGRCWSGREFFTDGQIYDLGGELIDQGHNQIRNLAQELSLDLDNLLQGEANDTELRGYFDNAAYCSRTSAQTKKAWQKLTDAVAAS
jgi:monoamine oxidase